MEIFILYVFALMFSCCAIIKVVGTILICIYVCVCVYSNYINFLLGVSFTGLANHKI
jgi:hypothetical protein